MIIDSHKVSSNVLMIFATSIAQESRNLSEIVVYELNPDFEFRIEHHRSFSFIWPHETVSNLLYNTSFGLIVTGCEGAIEIFDAIELNVSLWNNEDTKFKNRYHHFGSILSIDYSPTLDLFALGSHCGTIHFLH